jgi:hypothetical protein
MKTNDAWRVSDVPHPASAGSLRFRIRGALRVPAARSYRRASDAPRASVVVASGAVWRPASAAMKCDRIRHRRPATGNRRSWRADRLCIACSTRPSVCPAAHTAAECGWHQPVPPRRGHAAGRRRHGVFERSPRARVYRRQPSSRRSSGRYDAPELRGSWHPRDRADRDTPGQSNSDQPAQPRDR